MSPNDHARRAPRFPPEFQSPSVKITASRCSVCLAFAGVEVRRLKRDPRFWCPLPVPAEWEADYHREVDKPDLRETDICAMCRRKKLKPRTA